MTELLKLLEENRTWSVEGLALQLKTTPDDVKRRMEFLEHTGLLRRAGGCGHDCKGCAAHCGTAGIQSGMPVFWETVKKSVP